MIERNTIKKDVNVNLLINHIKKYFKNKFSKNYLKNNHNHNLIIQKSLLSGKKINWEIHYYPNDNEISLVDRTHLGKFYIYNERELEHKKVLTIYDYLNILLEDRIINKLEIEEIIFKLL